MRKIMTLNENWIFTHHDGSSCPVDIPHTWNALDGQDGGDDYFRGTCQYEKTFACPEFDREQQRVYLEFTGVNASARVTLNGQQVMTHDGGYSTFRADITEYLQPQNSLQVAVDNSKNDYVYPQKADFTFYGGIYREVNLLIVSKCHFDLDYYGGKGLAVTPVVEGSDGKVRVRTWHNCDGEVAVTLYDSQGKAVAAGTGTDITLTIPVVHLWDGLNDPCINLDCH